MGVINKNDFKKLGKDVIFAELVNIENPGNISIADNVEFKYGVHVEAWHPVEIGSNTHFAPHCVLYGPLMVGKNVAVAAHVVLAAVGHGYDRTDIPMVEQIPQSSPIVIEDDVWIGANATIIGGVRIGTGSIIGAGAVVTKDVEPWSIMGGVPARLIRKRKC